MQKTTEWTFAVAPRRCSVRPQTWTRREHMVSRRPKCLRVEHVVFFFRFVSLPRCSSGLFAKRLACLVPFSLVSVPCCAFDLCCAHDHERCLCCLKKQKVASGGTNPEVTTTPSVPSRTRDHPASKVRSTHNPFHLAAGGGSRTGRDHLQDDLRSVLRELQLLGLVSGVSLHCFHDERHRLCSQLFLTFFIFFHFFKDVISIFFSSRRISCSLAKNNEYQQGKKSVFSSVVSNFIFGKSKETACKEFLAIWSPHWGIMGWKVPTFPCRPSGFWCCDIIKLKFGP